MGRVWQRDLSRSARDFLEVVWPAIRHRVSGGEIVPVEAEDGDLRAIMDRLAGIDAWQVVEERGLRGIATRIQWPDKRSYDTFTIRYRRDNQQTTEFEKKLLAITATDHHGQNMGWIYPHLTIQAYIDESSRQFLAAGIVRTRDLFLWVAQELGAGIGRERTSERPYLKHNGDNADMMVCPWSAMKEAAIEMKIIRPRDVGQGQLLDQRMA